MGMGFAPTWLRQVSPPASQNHVNHWCVCVCVTSTVIPADTCPPDSPTGYAPLVDPAIVPFLQPVTTTQLN